MIVTRSSRHTMPDKESRLEQKKFRDKIKTSYAAATYDFIVRVSYNGCKQGPSAWTKALDALHASLSAGERDVCVVDSKDM